MSTINRNLTIIRYKINENHAFFSSRSGLDSTPCFRGLQGKESGSAWLVWEAADRSLVLACFWRDAVRNGLASDPGIWGRKTRLCISKPQGLRLDFDSQEIIVNPDNSIPLSFLSHLCVCGCWLNPLFSQSNTWASHKESMPKGL